MTLSKVFDKKRTQSIKQVMPDELIVYKAAVLTRKQYPIIKKHYWAYVSPLCRTEYTGGEQSNEWDRASVSAPVVEQPDRKMDYYLGFHSFTKEASAGNWFKRSRLTFKSDIHKYSYNSEVVLTCGVLKDWIIAIGFEGDRDMVIVSNRIITPHYPHTDIRYDKKCQWFFEAYKQTNIKLDILNKKKVDCELEIEKFKYRWGRKHRD